MSLEQETFISRSNIMPNVVLNVGLDVMLNVVRTSQWCFGLRLVFCCLPLSVDEHADELNINNYIL